MPGFFGFNWGQQERRRSTSSGTRSANTGGSPRSDSRSLNAGAANRNVSLQYYGPSVGEHSRDQTFGPTGQRLQMGQVAVSPDILRQYPLGSEIVVNGRTYTVGDVSYRSPGRPNTNTVEIWNGDANGPDRGTIGGSPRSGRSILDVGQTVGAPRRSAEAQVLDVGSTVADQPFDPTLPGSGIPPEPAILPGNENSEAWTTSPGDRRFLPAPAATPEATPRGSELNSPFDSWVNQPYSRRDQTPNVTVSQVGSPGGSVATNPQQEWWRQSPEVQWSDPGSFDVPSLSLATPTPPPTANSGGDIWSDPETGSINTGGNAIAEFGGDFTLGEDLNIDPALLNEGYGYPWGDAIEPDVLLAESVDETDPSVHDNAGSTTFPEGEFQAWPEAIRIEPNAPSPGMQPHPFNDLPPGLGGHSPDYIGYGTSPLSAAAAWDQHIAIQGSTGPANNAIGRTPQSEEERTLNIPSQSGMRGRLNEMGGIDYSPAGGFRQSDPNSASLREWAAGVTTARGRANSGQLRGQIFGTNAPRAGG